MNNSIRQTVKYQKGRERCKCGGKIMYDCSLTQKLPLGMGFRGGRFVIDTVVRRGFGGNCMDCHAPIFAVVSQRAVTRAPRSVNAKINAARKLI